MPLPNQSRSNGPFGSMSTSALAPADEYELGPGDEESGNGGFNVGSRFAPSRPGGGSARDRRVNGPSKLSLGGSTTPASLAAHAKIVHDLEAPIESVLWDEDDEDAEVGGAKGMARTPTESVSASDADGDIGKLSKKPRVL